MLPLLDAWQSGVAAADVLWAQAAGSAALDALQRTRLARLVAGARRDSALYRRLLRDVDPAAPDLLEQLAACPVVHKAELMRRFDEWVTDPRLKLSALRRFVADRTRIAEPWLGRYVVWESSGSRGEPGIFVQEPAAMAVYDALEALRRPWSARRLADPWFAAERIAFVGATGGHFAAAVSTARLRRLSPLLADRVHAVSFLQPVAAIVAELEALAPTIIGSYPTTALVLAEQAAAGRLHLDLHEIRTGGETLTAPMRRRLRQAFGCPVVDSYGASEFFTLACECPLGRLHLNSDWALLESVDAQGRPVPDGEIGDTALLTNLANHVQPLIRYDLGDRILRHAARCDCGSALPVIEVQGRSDDLLRLAGADGGRLSVAPLALCTVLEDEAGLFDFRLEQRSDTELLLAVPGQGGQAQRALARAKTVLAAYLARQGAAPVRIRCRSAQASQPGRGGKLQRVVARAA